MREKFVEADRKILDFVLKYAEIINKIQMPHMALLRNLRNIFSELDDKDRDLAINI